MTYKVLDPTRHGMICIQLKRERGGGGLDPSRPSFFTGIDLRKANISLWQYCTITKKLDMYIYLSTEPEVDIRCQLRLRSRHLLLGIPVPWRTITGWLVLGSNTAFSSTAPPPFHCSTSSCWYCSTYGNFRRDRNEIPLQTKTYLTFPRLVVMCRVIVYCG